MIGQYPARMAGHALSANAVRHCLVNDLNFQILHHNVVTRGALNCSCLKLSR
jgi:hypothetical protein